MEPVRLALIVTHATAATVAFALGFGLVVRLPQARRSVGFQVYPVCVWVAVASLITLVVVDWARLDPARRIAFPVLARWAFTSCGERNVRAHGSTPAALSSDGDSSETSGSC